MMKIQFISLWLFILIIDASTPQKIEPEVSGLRCEYLTNPIGLDVLNPRLSWHMKKDVRGARQSAYRIMVATRDELLLNDSPDLWDSGKIESDQSIQVTYNIDNHGIFNT